MTCQVKVLPSGHTFGVEAHETILEAALRQNVGLPYGCRDGACGACKGKVLEGEVKQDGSTAQMVFPVAAVISFLSQFVTLEPGDIVSTGTPSGVGSAKGTYLKPGDVVVAAIEGIGKLVNPFIAEEE